MKGLEDALRAWDASGGLGVPVMAGIGAPLLDPLDPSVQPPSKASQVGMGISTEAPIIVAWGPDYADVEWAIEEV
eukprot:CAMPEP_0168695890 /NCGR_PEP_ID=MMETSP0503-20121227/35058_1 /TAXON_ID=89963 /ORGANISM="Heterocapsa rotundata, Strain SCCAP K-0483" /LENGTH=74 /DNA_ID=CAMNT_0008741611 /DNA_START=1 /DNA_END=222 /DNA_ORIENTATION=-